MIQKMIDAYLNDKAGKNKSATLLEAVEECTSCKDDIEWIMDSVYTNHKEYIPTFLDYVGEYQTMCTGNAMIPSNMLEIYNNAYSHIIKQKR